MLVFTDSGTSRTAQTDSNGAYSIELPAGTWTVDTKSYVRIISGPRKVVVNAGATVVANYVVDTGIRPAALRGSAAGEPTQINTAGN